MSLVTIFGAGPALGLSTARRFARDGHAIALVGRHDTTVEPLAAELRADGATVATALADLAEPNAALGALDEIRARHGDPETVVYAPGDVGRLPVDVRALDAATLATWLPLNLLTPVALAHAAVAPMVTAGTGAFVAVQGVSARTPMTQIASTGVAQAGLLHYLHTLAAEVAPQGVRVGSLLVGSLIERSAAARLLEEGHFDGIDTSAIPRADPDVLADRVHAIALGGAGVEVAA